MHLNGRMRTAGALVFAGVLIACVGGCQSTIPTAASGVLSNIHQKTLALATERAMAAAGIDHSVFGNAKVLATCRGVGQADLGKQHVESVVMEELRKQGVTIVDDPSAATATASFALYNAGVDVKQGSFLFSRWIDTIGEVRLRMEFAEGGGAPVQREGAGTAKFHQAWFMDMGPSESLK